MQQKISRRKKAKQKMDEKSKLNFFGKQKKKILNDGFGRFWSELEIIESNVDPCNVAKSQ